MRKIGVNVLVFFASVKAKVMRCGGCVCVCALLLSGCTSMPKQVRLEQPKVPGSYEVFKSKIEQCSTLLDNIMDVVLCSESENRAFLKDKGYSDQRIDFIMMSVKSDANRASVGLYRKDLVFINYYMLLEKYDEQLRAVKY